ncbi:unnamed protein product [Effrenium voratum]|nr:unnamed protein product [Effrenium voratum]
MADVELQDGWEKRESRSQPGTFYYVQPETGKTSVEAPAKKRKVAPWPTLPDASKNETSKGLFDDLPDASQDTVPAVKSQHVPQVEKPVTSIRCLHILKKHTKSRRPSSWREKVITRTLEEATYQLKELRKGLEAKATTKERQTEFERLARKESDCGSAREGGSLGKFGRGQMQKPFEDAAFALEVNQMSSSAWLRNLERVICLPCWLTLDVPLANSGNSGTLICSVGHR